jgi:hypothetical protein
MKAALLAFVAAAVFSAATITGALRLGSSQPATSVIVLRAQDGVAARAGAPLARRVGRAAVRQWVEHANLSAYQVRRARREQL